MQHQQFAVGFSAAVGKRLGCGWAAASIFLGALTGVFAAAPNELQFSSAAYSVQETSPGFIAIPVLYGGGATNAVTVVCATSGGTAGRYIGQTNTLTFNPGETSQSFTVLILDN